MTARIRLRPPAYLALLAALAVVYFAAAKLGLSLAFLAPQVSPVWPPTGIALAAVLLLGFRVWPGIALGAFAANWTAQEPAAVAAGIALGNTLEAVAGAGMLRLAGFRPALDRLRDVCLLAGLGVVVAPAVSASVGVASLCLGGIEPWDRFAALWRVWWLGDGLGALVVAPLILVWTAERPALGPRRHLAELALLLVALALVGGLVFSSRIPSLSPSAALAYTVFPFVIWGAVRFGPPGATATSFVTSVAAIAGVAAFAGPFAADSAHRGLMMAQAYLAVVAITGLFLAAAIAERDAVERRRTEAAREARAGLEAEAAFRRAVEHSTHAGIATVDLAGRQTYVNPAFVRLVGWSERELVGTTPPFPYWPPEEMESIRRAFEATVDGTAPTEGFHLRFQRRGGERFDALVHISPLIQGAGRPAGWLASVYDVTDRRLLEDELRRRARELAEADRRKDEFLAMLGHELRNPLAPVSNALHVLRARGPAGATEARMLGILEHQVDHLSRLVDDLLDVSRITRSGFALRRQPLDLGRLVATAAETAMPQVAARGHRLRVAIPAEPVAVDADPVRLEQVVANLLSNAVKYTEPGGELALVAERDGGEAVVRMRDDGLGIAPELLPHVFELFSQGDRSLDRSQGGLGIGLTLVQRIVELHGGTVKVRSEGPGRGTEVTVRLPALAALPVVAGSSDAAEEVAEPAGGTSPGARLRVLVVDDHADAAATLAELLRLAGHSAEVANDGPQALAAARRQRPHAVLLDLGLPGMDGYEVARRMREVPELEGVLLIALTGYGRDEDRRRSRAAGIDHHLVKPVDVKRMQELLAGAG